MTTVYNKTPLPTEALREAEDALMAYIQPETGERYASFHPEVAVQLIARALTPHFQEALKPEEFRFTDEEWRTYQSLPDQGYSHRHHLEYVVNRFLKGKRNG